MLKLQVRWLEKAWNNLHPREVTQVLLSRARFTRIFVEVRRFGLDLGSLRKTKLVSDDNLRWKYLKRWVRHLPSCSTFPVVNTLFLNSKLFSLFVLSHYRQVRHDNKDQLEKLKDTVILIEQKLSPAITLDTHSSRLAAMKSTKFNSGNKRPGSCCPVYIMPPGDDK